MSPPAAAALPAGQPDGGLDHPVTVQTSGPVLVAGGLMLLFIGLSVANNGGDFLYWFVALAGLALFGYGAVHWVYDYWPGRPEDTHPNEHAPLNRVTPRKLGTWVFLLTEAMVFATLFATYLRYRWSAGEEAWVSSAELIWHGNWVSWMPGVVNSLIMVLSSLTLILGTQALKRGNRERMVQLLTVTLVLGATFLAIKAYEWDHLSHEDFSELDPDLADGFWLDSSLAGTTFYITTGTHGAHVLAGLFALSFIILKGRKGGYNKDNLNTLEYFGLYWHFVDLLWLFVFAAFYLL